MSDGRPKPAIPAWQRASQPRPTATEDPVYSQAEKSEPETVHEGEQNTSTSEQSESASPDDTPPAAASTATPLETQADALKLSDFETFTQQQQPPRQDPPPPVQQRPSAPPIITYPEFLIEAHKPPPLITPTRILNALYVAGGITAVLYGASRWIISPTKDNLNEARHEFLGHSQSKIEEFNERLSKVVSKIPEGKKDAQNADTDVEDVESVTSDPTELYHRDMGTQTSPPPSRRSSLPDVSVPPKKDAVTYQTGALEILRDHVKQITEGVEGTVDSVKDRQDTINKLRHYLDGMIYGNAGALWQSSEDVISMKSDAVPKDDPIEELKKEIRGVKGVLLSSKRFPSANRTIAGTA